MRQLIVASLLVGSFLVSACTKQKSFPGESVTGKNVLGCYIDQVEFIPCSSLLQGQLSNKTYTYPNPLSYQVEIEAKNRCNNNYKSLEIKFSQVLLEENKTYAFGSQVSCFYFEDLTPYYSDSTLGGSITIRKFDPVAKILAANFQVVLRSSDCTKNISITRGTFDIRLSFY